MEGRGVEQAVWIIDCKWPCRWLGADLGGDDDLRPGDDGLGVVTQH